MNQSEPVSNKGLLLLLGFYSILLVLSAPILIQGYDIFYYWDWSRHLSLSYFDGPPLIAYVLHLVSALFGSHLFVINLLADFLTLLTAFMVYQLARLFLNINASMVAAGLWLLSPLTTQYLIRYLTYDSLLNLFWVVTLFCVANYLQSKKNKYIYFTGISIGLIMLSKYTGGLLVFLLLAYLLVNRDYRSIFKNKHFYLSIALSLIIFSPVIIWNVKHNWVSFHYLYHHHTLSVTTLKNSLKNFFNSLLNHVLVVLNLLFFVILWGCFRFKKETKHFLYDFLFFITAGFFLVYQALAWKVKVKTGWLLPGLISASILTSYFIQKARLKKTLIGILSFYLFANGVILLVDSVFKKQLTLEGGRMMLAKKFSEQYADQKAPLFTSGYSTARMFFFFKNKPQVFAFGPHANEYQFWTKPILKKIKKGEIKQAIYFSYAPDYKKMLTYFKTCQKQPVIRYKQKLPFSDKIRKTYLLYVYSCSNP